MSLQMFRCQRLDVLPCVAPSTTASIPANLDSSP
jgi:hypothetical protein